MIETIPPTIGIAVFCGARTGNNPIYSDMAKMLGAEIASRGLTLVYGGGHVGLMGVLADAVLGAGGRVIGVIPEALATKELAHDRLTILHVVKNMHERKAAMEVLSDSFVAMPGGFGTLDEFCEMLTWAQLGMQSRPVGDIKKKPCGMLNVNHYFDPFLAQVDKGIEEGFLSELDRSAIFHSELPGRLLDLMGIQKCQA